MNRKNQILTFTISTVLLVILSGTAFGNSVGPVDVTIDIKPGSEPNSINNNGKGVIPVAIFGSADFDVSQINLSTVDLEGCGIKEVGKKGKLLAHYEDVNTDGFVDLVVQIENQEGTFNVCDTSATLTGELFGGILFEGTDSIRIVPQ